jgi:aryl-alcohol dehydrogenase-like predicted oxidoreductase
MNLCGKLGLGTVQWGMPYGIANTTGRPETFEVGRMLELARKSGITLLDTAHGYGGAERAIGCHQDVLSTFKIVTKTLPLRSNNLDGADVSAVSQAFNESINRLGCSTVYGLLVHNTEDLLVNEANLLWEMLQELKFQGFVSKIGVSVYAPEQLEQILDAYPIDLVQLPFNLYDQSFLRAGLLERLKAHGVEVHARSAFLQGLLLIPPNRLPAKFEAIHDHHAKLYETFDATGLKPLEGCLRFCLEQPWIDRVIVGCETSEQLSEILEVAAGSDVCFQRTDQFALKNESFINPARWPQ